MRARRPDREFTPVQQTEQSSGLHFYPLRQQTPQLPNTVYVLRSQHQVQYVSLQAARCADIHRIVKQTPGRIERKPATYEKTNQSSGQEAGPASCRTEIRLSYYCKLSLKTPSTYVPALASMLIMMGKQHPPPSFCSQFLPCIRKCFICMKDVTTPIGSCGVCCLSGQKWSPLDYSDYQTGVNSRLDRRARIDKLQ